MDTIGERLKQMRKLKKMKQSDLSNLSGVSTSNISRIEKNEISPTVNILLHICKSLNISIDWLLTGEGDMTKESPPDDVDRPHQPPPGEYPIGPLTSEEKLLVENFRDMNERDKVEIQRKIATKLSFNKNRKLSGSENIESDGEIADELIG